MKRWFSLLTLSIILLLTACDEKQGIAVGGTAPDFSLPNAAGGEVSLADFQGKPVLLYFHMAVG